MKDEIENVAFGILGILLLLSLLTNGYLIGNKTDNSDQLRIYEQLSKQSDITTGLLQDRIRGAEETITSLRELSDEYRTTIGELQAINTSRARLDSIAEELSGRVRAEIIEGITGIERGSARIGELEEAEQRERSILENANSNE